MTLPLAADLRKAPTARPESKEEHVETMKKDAEKERILIDPEKLRIDTDLFRWWFPDPDKDKRKPKQ